MPGPRPQQQYVKRVAAWLDSSLLTAKIGIIAANPVLADGRKEVGGERIFERFAQVRRMGWNDQAFACAEDALLARHHEAQPAVLDHGDLLAQVMMERYHGPLAKANTRNGHGFPVDHLTGDRGIQLLFGYLGPLVMRHGDPVFYHGTDEMHRIGGR